MAHDEVATRPQQCKETVDQADPSGLVEVDHHVAKEDGVKKTERRKRLHQIGLDELHAQSQRVSYHEEIGIVVSAFEAISLEPTNGYLVGRRHRVHAFVGLFHHPS